ncbi:hypothetical protein [Muricoccus pecuniae]|uniref:Uncharacterized protein n=1 Tax=Muricoccus pecuniae TaxID=693023 RepID=A0A840Y0Q1_9PROT|nr:hypothetical protein [Roseomonas pecuniae]MBB5694285.1 hypothetical protein [Roseomonas pecuniae]
MRPLLLALPALLPLLAPAALAQEEVQSRAVARGVTPRSTGDAGCDEAASAWRACIAASPKPAPDKVQANTEVDKFVRDVFDARGAHRDNLLRACGRTASGYRQMVGNGTCAANITGARDDQATRAEAPPGSLAAQRRQR